MDLQRFFDFAMSVFGFPCQNAHIIKTDAVACVMDVFIDGWILISIFGILLLLRLLILVLLETHSHFAAGFTYIKVITRPTWYVVDGPTFVGVFGGVFWFHEEWSDGVDGFVVHVDPMLFEIFVAVGLKNLILRVLVLRKDIYEILHIHCHSLHRLS